MGSFIQYYKAHGIKLEKAITKTPELNGITERMNKTI